MNKEFSVSYINIFIIYLKTHLALGTRLPLQALTFCDGEQDDGSRDLFNQVLGLSATKKSEDGHYYRVLSAENLIRRFSDPFSDNMPLPWSCHMEVYLRDLGEGYFPRFVKDGTCVNTTCWYGHYACHPVKYRVTVIKQQKNECIDRSLPSILATKWRQRSLEVTSNCACKRV